VRPFSFCYLTEVGGHCISTTETPEEFSLIWNGVEILDSCERAASTRSIKAIFWNGRLKHNQLRI
jgi:hypothetical protein